MKGILVLAAVGALLLLSCSDSTEEDPTTAFKLAVIDGENPADNGDPVVADYQSALDRAVAVCTQGPDPDGDTPGVSDLAVSMADRQPENWTVLTALEGIADSIPPEGGPMDCIEISAALLTLTG